MIVLSDTFRTALKSRFLTDSEFRTLTAYLITGEGKLSDKLAMLAEAIEEDTNQAKAYAKQKKTHQNELIRQRVQRFREREREDFSPSDGNECNALPPLHGECNDCNASNGYLTIPYHTIPYLTIPNQAKRVFKSFQTTDDSRVHAYARIRRPTRNQQRGNRKRNHRQSSGRGRSASSRHGRSTGSWTSPRDLPRTGMTHGFSTNGRLVSSRATPSPRKARKHT